MATQKFVSVFRTIGINLSVFIVNPMHTTAVFMLMCNVHVSQIYSLSFSLHFTLCSSTRYINEHSIYDNSMYPDIFVMKPALMFAMLRNFGPLITHLDVEFEIYRKQRAKFNLMSQYLNEYSSESLIHLSLIRSHWSFENFDKQFLNVKSLQINGAMNRLNNFVDTKLLEKFQNLQFLKIFYNSATIPFNVKIHYPNLKHLYFYERFYCSCWEPSNYGETLDENLKTFLKMNKQIETLEMGTVGYWHPPFFQWIAQNLPNLQHLSLTYVSCLNLINPIYFPDVRKFTFRVGEDHKIPFSFRQLNHLKLTQIETSSAQKIVEFISENKHLKTINIQGITNRLSIEIFRLFEFEHTLLNLEELIIDGIYEPWSDNIPTDSLFRFLKRNVSLKRISLIMVKSFFTDQLFSSIMMRGDLYDAKIRNHALELTIRRISDGSIMKYLIRKTKFPCIRGIVGPIEYEDFLEFCNYREPTIIMNNLNCPEDIRRLWEKYTDWC